MTRKICVTQRKRYKHVGIFALGDAEVTNANSFALQWNIGLIIPLQRGLFKTVEHLIPRQSLNYYKIMISEVMLQKAITRNDFILSKEASPDLQDNNLLNNADCETYLS